MTTVECSDPAYNRIKGSKIEQMIFKNKKHLGIYLGDIPCSDKGEKIIKTAKKALLSRKSISERSELYKDIAELSNAVEEEYFMRHEFGDRCVEYPGLLSYLILGKEIFNYERLGFTSMRSLEEAVVSFCISERQEYDSYDADSRLIWRNNGKKNILHQNVHGDMYVGQTDVSGNEQELMTFFGNKTYFDSMKLNPKSGGVYCCQDWSGYLITALKFAEKLGKSKIPEIVGWQDIYRNTHHGGNYSEAGDDASFGLNSYITMPVISKGEKLDGMPLFIPARSAGEKYPYFENDRLFYLAEDQEGNIDLSHHGRIFKGKKYSKIVEYAESDLPNILKGCYKLFSRVVADMIFIMKDFNEKHA